MEEYREILKKCYNKKNIKLHHVDKLIKSVYPMQVNDYLLSKIPNTNHFVPIDFNIYGIVKKLWKEGFITLGWDEGSEMQMGFVTLKKSKTTLNKLIKLFGKDNIIINNIFKIKVGKKKIEYEKKLLNLKTFKIYIDIDIPSNFIAIKFDCAIIPKINKLLGVKKTTRKPLPGIVSCGDILKIDYDKFFVKAHNLDTY